MILRDYILQQCCVIQALVKQYPWVGLVSVTTCKCFQLTLPCWGQVQGLFVQARQYCTTPGQCIGFFTIILKYNVLDKIAFGQRLYREITLELVVLESVATLEARRSSPVVCSVFFKTYLANPNNETFLFLFEKLLNLVRFYVKIHNNSKIEFVEPKV